ncbi:uncharacterized protein LOC129225668 isoform X1 [Uloborus diversus]|uniref:uncharacterized protein LOC129225668 isoform X1 n=2 Tax=Uloborus diversus TaxID=327109 RepID=UPI0024094427|nr:uncharacterized protein LOC129225668 isoform X1 [Uloborus diversus]
MLEMNSYLHVLNRLCEKVQQNMANKPKEMDTIDWDVNVEILLFYAMIGHKPVGVNRSFMMLCIHQKFSTYINRQITSKAIWNHLESMYDMAALHESEDLPFPNDEQLFDLPEEYDELIASQLGVEPERSTSEKELPKTNTALKVSKKLSSTKLKQNSTPVSTSKSTFVTPVVSKIGKNNIKNEPKSPTVENTAKLKFDTPVLKTNKVKRSSSPFSTKAVKPESAPVVKDEIDATVSKKSRSERSASPANTKRNSKLETSITNSASKKFLKQEQNSTIAKQGKSEAPDNNKKVKNEKEVANKKGKTLSTENNVKKKYDSGNGNKKKIDVETNSKKGDSVGNKQKLDAKNSSSTSKGSKADDTEHLVTPASRKSSPVVKGDANDNVKKGSKRQRAEDSSKKVTPVAKRRRT